MSEDPIVYNEGAEKSLFTRADFASIPEVNPLALDRKKPNVSDLPPLAGVGYKLSKFILFIISGYLLLLGGYLIFTVFDASDHINMTAPLTLSDTAFKRQLDLIKTVQEIHKSKRDFVSQTSQMVLLNLLLPTLTAVLGYIFGSKEGPGA